MSYASRREMGSGNKTGTIIIVALIHVALGYALVSGLALRVVEKAAEDLKTFDVENEPPPPPEEPPPPPPEPQQVQTPPPVVAPPPIVRTNPQPPPVTTVNVAPPPQVTTTAPVTPPAPTPPAPPPPPRIEPAAPRGDVRGLFSGDDYPSRALRNEEEGSARARLTIGTNGRVTGCTIVQSTGSSSLDDATCKVLQRRARFTPGTDSTGAKVVSEYTTPTIVWRIQGR
ncbi:energy transducer TonB [Sphingomicrobium aestuariivivum]|uniref:energy transducer TonB n=1 Tax=Sphingomicrobium aestuariivivum TaxID=1582356 RepID=UPI001FD71C97|nr:energy transducer TonB [Sphingomicrobium aestuariivivum]MCJ8191849.1 energy transducer TonB [Sphingomicrobium aestuariivivum]